MKKLGSASPDWFKGIAALTLVLGLTACSVRFSVLARSVVGTVVFVVFVLWYFERYTFFERFFSFRRGLRFWKPARTVSADNVVGIKFHRHFDLATGPLVYISFMLEGKKDLVAFNFRERHLFLLDFAVLNGIPVDCGGQQWIEKALQRARVEVMPPKA